MGESVWATINATFVIQRPQILQRRDKFCPILSIASQLCRHQYLGRISCSRSQENSAGIGIFRSDLQQGHRPGITLIYNALRTRHMDWKRFQQRILAAQTSAPPCAKLLLQRGAWPGLVSGLLRGHSWPTTDQRVRPDQDRREVMTARRRAVMFSIAQNYFIYVTELNVLPRERQLRSTSRYTLITPCRSIVI